MNVLRQFFQPLRLHVYTDGAIRPEQGVTGLAAVVRDEEGAVRRLWSQRSGPMTCNEAEYAAVIFALESLRELCPIEIAVYSDSRVVVDQMQGHARARAEGLRKAYTRTRALAAQYEKVSFHHIPRKRNRLADALANEAADGFHD